MQQFLEVAGSFVNRMPLVAEFSLPASGHIRFHVVAPSGVYAGDEFKEEDLAGGNHEFSP